VRPRCEAPRMPRHCIPAGCVHDRPSTKTGDVGVSPMLSFAGVRSPPLQERRSKVTGGLAGEEPGDGAKGGFLGGTHSVRPQGMAKRVPRDSVFTRWPGGAGSPTGTCPDGANTFPPGVRSPPLRESFITRMRFPRCKGLFLCEKLCPGDLPWRGWMLL
jgi:hypothetical protein